MKHHLAVVFFVNAANKTCTNLRQKARGNKNKCKASKADQIDGIVWLNCQDSSHGSGNLVLKIVPLKQQRPQHVQCFVGRLMLVFMNTNHLGWRCWTGRFKSYCKIH